MFRLQLSKLAFDIRRKLPRPLHKSKTLHLTNRSDRRRKRKRMRLVGMTMGEVMILKELSDLFTRRAEPQRNIGRSDSLRRHQNIRNDSPVIHRKPLASAPPSCHHLIRNQQNTVLIANSAKLW